ncbi:MAG: hypothetical protein Q8Q89_02305 [bacterium]|nr:hypothetical protein [bacterium]
MDSLVKKLTANLAYCLLLVIFGVLPFLAILTFTVKWFVGTKVDNLDIEATTFAVVVTLVVFTLANSVEILVKHYAGSSKTNKSNIKE